MKILIDLTTLQIGMGYGGASTYTLTVMNHLLHRADEHITFYGLYDSAKPFIPYYNISQLTEENHIELLDLQKCPIREHIHTQEIDTFFIPLAQFLAPYDTSGINCRTVMLIHDIFDVEDNDSHLSMSLYDPNILTLKGYIKHIIRMLTPKYNKSVKNRYADIIRLYNQPNVIAGTVSEYSKYALQYHFPELNKDIHVWYSPAKQVAEIADKIENNTLSKALSEKWNYFLLVSANRKFKNAHLAIKAFRRYRQDHPDWHLILVNYPHSDEANGIHALPPLVDSDLEYAYKHAQALLFPSLYEGFGYPPVEALKYGVPSIVANVTSISEVMADCAYFFSPMYTADLYRAMCTFYSQHDKIEQKSRLDEAYQRITKRQATDLNNLVDCIINNNYYE